jgi:hypothetical protein
MTEIESLPVNAANSAVDAVIRRGQQSVGWRPAAADADQALQTPRSGPLPGIVE